MPTPTLYTRVLAYAAIGFAVASLAACGTGPTAPATPPASSTEAAFAPESTSPRPSGLILASGRGGPLPPAPGASED